MSKWQDISISDNNLKAEFITRFFNGDYVSAFRIIEDNPQLNTKAFLENVMNEISNLLSLLQNNFQSNVIDYLANELDGFNNLINEFNLKGSWDSETTYEIYNFVIYNNIDYLYINPTPSSGNLPTNTNYWLEINIRGETGEPGLGVNLKYDWDSTIEYQPLDVVYYSNALWVATATNVNKRPDESSGTIWQTLTGNIITFTNNNGLVIQDIDVNFSPIQDLHGYDNPWPSGGGKNKLNNTATTTTSNGVTFTVNADGSVSCSGTATGTAVLRIYQTFDYAEDMILNGCPSGGNYSNGYSVIAANSVGSPVDNCVDVGSGARVHANYLASIAQIQIIVRTGTNMNGKVFYPMLRLASVTDPTYAPYSNICPISGWTNVTVTRTGVNVLNLSEWELENNSGVTIGTDYISIINKPYQERLNRYNVLNRSACVFSFHVKTIALGDSRASFAVYADGTNKLLGNGTTDVGNILLDSVGTEKDITLTVPSGTEYISFGGWAWNGEVQISNLQLELGSTATDYEAYSGTTVAISFGQTVYGGKLTVNEDGSGQVVAEWAKYVIDGSTNAFNVMSDSGTYKFVSKANYTVRGYNTSVSNDPPTLYCNMFKAEGIVGLGNTFISGKCFRVCIDPSFADVAAFNTYLTEHNLEYVYKLETPITIPVTAQQIQTLVGVNNVWADTNEDTTIELAQKYWEIFLPFKLIKIYSNTTAPTGDDLYNGAIWFEMLTS